MLAMAVNSREGHFDRGSQGGFERPPQHLGGGRDEEVQTAIGPVRAPLQRANAATLERAKKALDEIAVVAFD